jgi:hypothetical protein
MSDEQKQTSEKPKGLYTPLRTPVEVGQESGGEYQFNRSSSTPTDNTAK